MRLLSHAFPAGSARAQAYAPGSRGPAGGSPGAPPGACSPRPFFPALSAQPGGVARGSPLARASGATGGRTGGLWPGFSRAAGLSAELPIGFWGSPHPWPPGEGSGPRVWSGQGVWGADRRLIVVLGGNFLPGEGSLPSPLTFFPLPMISARGEGSGTFLYFCSSPPDPPGCALGNFSIFLLFCGFSSEISIIFPFLSSEKFRSGSIVLLGDFVFSCSYLPIPPRAKNELKGK